MKSLSPNPKIRLGKYGEAAVVRYYRGLGGVVIDRNWHCRWGEIDLVIYYLGRLLFVEVKTRRSEAFGRSGEVISELKIERVCRSVEQYLNNKGYRGDFEVVFAIVNLANERAKIQFLSI